MSEKPILFSAPMVRAILAGMKTQTRRVVKPQPSADLLADYAEIRATRGSDRTDAQMLSDCLPCPYGEPGTKLWVREAWAIVPRTAYRCSEGVQQTLRPDDDHDAAIYRAGWDRSNGGFRWRPSIHMPRWASRITLEVTGVRVERLCDISEADAMAEGAEPYPLPVHPDREGLRHVDGFRNLWESINGLDSWMVNPWVWVISFNRLEENHGGT